MLLSITINHQFTIKCNIMSNKFDFILEWDCQNDLNFMLVWGKVHSHGLVLNNKWSNRDIGQKEGPCKLMSLMQNMTTYQSSTPKQWYWCTQSSLNWWELLLKYPLWNCFDIKRNNPEMNETFPSDLDLLSEM